MDFVHFVKESKNTDLIDHALKVEVRNAIKQNGGKIYQVGGAVRDSLINKISKDLDIIVVGMELPELEKLLSKFGKVDVVGKSFGILKFRPKHFSRDEEEVDVSVPRVDSKSTGDGHKDFEIEFGKHITLQQDQLRRDFWMNALAMDIETGEIIDVDGKGMLDIENKQVRMVSPTSFEDDPLRMLRSFQFASRFEFRIEDETFESIKRNADKITSISPDRFKEEFHKLFSKSKSPSIGVKYMISSGVLGHLFPKVDIDQQTLEMMDTVDKKDYKTFLTLFFKSVKANEAVEYLKTGIRETKDVSVSVAKAIEFLRTKESSISDVDLVLFNLRAKEDVLQIVDNILKSDLVKRLDDLRANGIPTKYTELSVKGDELDVPKHERGNKLKELLVYAVTNKTNDRGTLLNN